MYSRLKKPNETIDQYSNHIVNEARRLNITDNTKLFIYINGLPSYLKEHVLLQDPVNFEEARCAAEDKEFIRDAIITNTSCKQENKDIHCTTEKRATPERQTHCSEVKKTILQENQRTKLFRYGNFDHNARNFKATTKTQFNPERKDRCFHSHYHTTKNQQKRWLNKVNERKVQLKNL